MRTLLDHEHEPVRRERRVHDRLDGVTIIEECATDGCDWFRARWVENAQASLSRPWPRS